MKKYILLTVFAAIAAAITSCQVDLSATQSGQEKPTGHPSLVSMSFRAGSEATKSDLNDNTISWMAGDAITVFGNNEKAYQSEALTTGGTSADFSVELPEGTTDPYAVYPADANATLSGSVITTTIPAVQTLSEGTAAAPGALVAVAKADGHAFAFRNAFSLVAVTPTIDGVSEITVSANGGEALAGKFAITVAAEPSATAAGDNVSTVTLKPFGNTFTKGTVYYITVAPGAVSDGLTIAYKTNEVAEKAFTLGRIASGSVTLPRNSGIELNTDPVIIIDSKAALDDWASFGSRNDYVAALYADIDYEGANWTPVDFENDFNGLGHKIYNIKVTPAVTTQQQSQSTSYKIFAYGFFGHFGYYAKKDAIGRRVYLKNITFGSKDGETYDGISEFVIGGETPSETVAGNAAAICPVVGYAEIFKITNFIPMRASSEAGNKVIRIGGIAALPGGNPVVNNCKNYGAISVECTAGAEPCIGGIVARFNQDATITNCENYGAITYRATTLANNPRIGGIAGYANGSTFRACKNTQNVTVIGSNANGSTAFVGGIVGHIGNSTILGCINDLTAKLTVDYQNGLNQVGGITGYVENANALISDLDGINTENKAEIEVHSSIANNKHYWIGGIVGFTAYACTIKNVTNSGNITLTTYTSSFSAAGGIIGRANKLAELSEATNFGSIDVTVNGNGNCYGGGIIGYNDGTITKVESNINNGDVSATKNTSIGDNTCSAGGIYGYLYTNSAISSCTNTAMINCNGYAGAIVGIARANITDCTIKKTGKVNGVSPTEEADLIVGKWWNNTFSASGTLVID